MELVAIDSSGAWMLVNAEFVRIDFACVRPESPVVKSLSPCDAFRLGCAATTWQISANDSVDVQSGETGQNWSYFGLT